MTDVQVTSREHASAGRAIGLVDCDVHTNITPATLHARLSPRWQRHLEEFGSRVPSAIAVYPRMRGGGSRLDARPANGLAGSDLGLLQEQLLDEYDIAHAILNPMEPQTFGIEARRSPRSCAVRSTTGRGRSGSTASRANWARSARTRAHRSRVAEVERLRLTTAVQVLLPTRMEQGLGNRRHWPILRRRPRRACRRDAHRRAGILSPLGLAVLYLDMHTLMSTTTATQLLSLICSGVFEDPRVAVVAVETGWPGPHRRLDD